METAGIRRRALLSPGYHGASGACPVGLGAWGSRQTRESLTPRAGGFGVFPGLWLKKVTGTVDALTLLSVRRTEGWYVG